jgi:hypothetical protein
MLTQQFILSRSAVAQADVGVVAYTNFLHPGSGRFCPLKMHVTVPASGSKFDASRSQKDERATEYVKSEFNTPARIYPSDRSRWQQSRDQTASCA